MPSAESECDVCGAKVPPKEKDPGELNLCIECEAQFGPGQAVRCC